MPSKPWTGPAIAGFREAQNGSGPPISSSGKVSAGARSGAADEDGRVPKATGDADARLAIALFTALAVFAIVTAARAATVESLICELSRLASATGIA
jgi:hypothetical protein